MKLKNRQNWSMTIEVSMVVTYGWWVVTGRRHKEVWAVGNIPYLDQGSSYMCVHTCKKNHWPGHNGWVDFIVCTLNCNFVNNLKIRIRILKLLEENIGMNVHDLNFGNRFIDWTLEAWAMKGKTDKLDFKKIIKPFVHQSTSWGM